MTLQPNILFLTHRVPHPPNRGDRIRSWNMLRFLSKRANMHLACLTDEPVSETSMAELRDHCQHVAIQPLSGPVRYVNGLKSLCLGGSITEGMFRSQSLKSTIRQWANDIRFDAVLVFCSSMYQFANCAELQGTPIVVDLVDVDSEKWLNYAASASLIKRLLYNTEARRVRQLERKIARSVDAVTLVSQEEVKVFRTFCKTQNIHAVSNGVDLDYFHPAPAEFTKSDRSQPFKLVFVGVLDYRPNIEGLRWFCREVWPNVRERIPGIELDLVGRNPGDAARQLAAHPGIHLIGEVDDVRPYVWNADVVIAPLTIARGIQNKVLEAMAMAKPIVATPEAIEGTRAVAGKHLMASSNHEEWLDAMMVLSRNVDVREKLSQAARAFAVEEYRWEARLVETVQLLGLANPRSPGAYESRRRNGSLASQPAIQG